jgi:hypothetical protein
MRIALALGLHPIAITTVVVPSPPGDSTRESYRARLKCVGGCHGPIGA